MYASSAVSGNRRGYDDVAVLTLGRENEICTYVVGADEG